MDKTTINDSNLNTVIITGGNTGLGYQCAKEIASARGWRVILACRDETRAAHAVARLVAETSNSHIEAMPLDLASLASVRRFAQDFLARDRRPLKALVCNAGIQIVTGLTYTPDGFETTFAVNHLGHFLLINLLLRCLEPPARIVIVSSGVHDPEHWSGMPAPRYQDAKLLAWPDRDPAARTASPGTAGRRAYTTSKLCNVLCAYELVRRLRHRSAPSPISVNVFDPGLLPGSGLARDYSPLQPFAWNFILPWLRLFVPVVSSPRKSGKALARLVLAPEFEGVSGKYFQIFKEIPSSKGSYDERKAADLWETSVELVKPGPEESVFHAMG